MFGVCEVEVIGIDGGGVGDNDKDGGMILMGVGESRWPGQCSQFIRCLRLEVTSRL